MKLVYFRTEDAENKCAEVSSRPEFDVSAWMILDCCFGVPLFEAEVNRSICASIVDTLANQQR